MSREATLFTREPLHDQPDLLIVLGKNIGVDSTRDDIREDRFHLSREGRFNALAAGTLWRPGMDIIFSTGNTAGEGMPSEAEAMKAYMQTWITDLEGIPVVPDENIILEEHSIDTAGNAEEVAKLLPPGKYNNIGLVSVGKTGHVDNAKTLFERYGVPIAQTFESESWVDARSWRHGLIVRDWRKSDRVQGEIKRENIRKKLLRIDRRGKLLRILTKGRSKD